MKWFKRKKEQSFYEREEQRLQDSLFLCDQYATNKKETQKGQGETVILETEPEYDAVLGRLERVHELSKDDGRIQWDPNALARTGGYILGILIVVGVEACGGLLRSEGIKLLPKP